MSLLWIFAALSVGVELNLLDASLPIRSRLRVLCYQFGGNSNSGLAVASEAMGGWRCLAVEKLSQIELRADAWHTEPRSPRQTCIDEIDFDADAQSGDNPQKGQ